MLQQELRFQQADKEGLVGMEPAAAVVAAVVVVGVLAAVLAAAVELAVVEVVVVGVADCTVAEQTVAVVVAQRSFRAERTDAVQAVAVELD